MRKDEKVWESKINYDEVWESMLIILLMIGWFIYHFLTNWAFVDNLAFSA
jgi:hypothetical protein